MLWMFSRFMLLAFAASGFMPSSSKTFKPETEAINRGLTIYVCDQPNDPLMKFYGVNIGKGVAITIFSPDKVGVLCIEEQDIRTSPILTSYELGIAVIFVEDGDSHVLAPRVSVQVPKENQKVYLVEPKMPVAEGIVLCTSSEKPYLFYTNIPAGYSDLGGALWSTSGELMGIVVGFGDNSRAIGISWKEIRSFVDNLGKGV